MRRLYAGVAGLALLAGCVSGPGLRSGGDSAYGVPIIRPGTAQTEVDRLVGPGAPEPSSGAPNPSEVVYPTGLHVRYEAGAVQACWSEGMITNGPGGAAVDADLAAAMKPGATPAEVAERLGAPAYGFEKKSGVVALYYPRPAVEVTFQDGRLTLWRRTRP
jgi:hypothetical protein